MKGPDKISLAEKFERNSQKEVKILKIFKWSSCGIENVAFLFIPHAHPFSGLQTYLYLYLYLSKVRTTFSADAFHLCFHLICCNEKGGVSPGHLSSGDTKISLLASHFSFKLCLTEEPRDLTGWIILCSFVTKLLAPS